MPNNSSDSTALHSLLQLTLSPANTDHAVAYLGSLRPEEREHFESVADSNHVVVRALQAALSRLQPGSETASWAPRSSPARSSGSRTRSRSYTAFARSWRAPGAARPS